jgi:hypothetical protein
VEEAGYKDLPRLRNIDGDMVMANYLNIKREIELVIRRHVNPDEDGGS